MRRRPVARAAVGVAIATLALSPAGCGDITRPASSPALYVASGATDQVFRLDPATGAIVDSVPVDLRFGELDEPHGLALGPGGRWYVTLSHGEPTLWAFERPGDRLVGRTALPTAGAARIAFAAGRAFIPDYDRDGALIGRMGRLSVVDLATLEPIAAPALCAAPHDVQPHDDSLLAVACSMSDEVVLLEAQTLEEVGRFDVGPDPGPFGRPAYKPLNLAWSPDGERLYVALHLTGEIAVFERDGERLATWPAGHHPAQIALAPDGGVLVVASRGGGTTRALDTRTGTVLWEAAMGPHPHGLALDDDGAVAFVAWEGTTAGAGGVGAVRVRDGTELWRTELGSYLLGVLYAP